MNHATTDPGDPFDDFPDDAGDGEPHRTAGRAARVPLPAVYRRRRWAAVGVLVVVLLTVVVLVRSLAGDGGERSGQEALTSGGGSAAVTTGTSSAVSGSASRTGERQDGTGPVPGVPTADEVGGLPPGGDVTQTGRGTWRGVGTPGAVAGTPGAADTRTVTYVVEVEQGTDTSSFGGGDSFSAMVDATLADPRSWIGDREDRIAFRHISVTGGDTPDLRIRLTTPDTTRRLCGGEIALETSCFVSGGDTTGEAGEGWVVINLARWVRGAVTFAGDLGAYRQYVVNHEVGHGIGHARHQPCPADGGLAPVMMQQTLSLANRDLVELDAGTEYSADGGADVDADAVCRANAWPHPEGP